MNDLPITEPALPAAWAIERACKLLDVVRVSPTVVLFATAIEAAFIDGKAAAAKEILPLVDDALGRLRLYLSEGPGNPDWKLKT